MASLSNVALPDASIVDLSNLTSDEIARFLWGVVPTEIVPSAPPLGKLLAKSEVRLRAAAIVNANLFCRYRGSRQCRGTGTRDAVARSRES